MSSSGRRPPTSPRRRSRFRRRRAAYAAAAALLVLVGCQDDRPARGSEVGKREGTVLPPKPRQSMEVAAREFQSAARSGDCERLRSLSFSGASPSDGTGCQRFVERLEGFQASATARYGTGGVVAFTANRRPGTMVFVLGRDGNFKWTTLLGRAREDEVVGTPGPPSGRLDAAAASAVRALRSGNCDQLAQAGEGILPEPAAAAAACENRGGQRAKLEQDPDAAPKRLGANSAVAFYSLLPKPDGPYFTLVLPVEDERAALLRAFAVPPRRGGSRR